MVDRCQLDLDRPAAAPAYLVEAGVHEEATQPRVEPIGIAKSRQIPPGPNEAILDGVLRPIGIAEDQPRGGVQSTDRGARQDREGVMIAPLRPLHAIALHVPLGNCGVVTARPRSNGMAPIVCQRFHKPAAPGSPSGPPRRFTPPRPSSPAPLGPKTLRLASGT